MLCQSTIQKINLFQREDTKRLICESRNWNEFSININNIGPDKKNNTKKGHIFELLTSLYFVNDPVYSTKLKHLWHHTNVPYKIVDLLDLQTPEIGVDLIAESNDGDFWAIQCKYHGDIYENISYDEVSTFFSVTERDITYSKLRHRIISFWKIGGRFFSSSPRAAGAGL